MIANGTSINTILKEKKGKHECWFNDKFKLIMD